MNLYVSITTHEGLHGILIGSLHVLSNDCVKL